MRYAIRTSAIYRLSSIVCRQSSVLKGVLMTNKALFCSFYVNFCAFCASLRPKTFAISAFSAVKKSCLCAFLWLKNPFNQRNLRKPLLINDLSPCKALYTSSDSSTDAERSLQNHLFMQNKPNFRKNQMNVTDLLTRDYERKDTWSSGKNKPNSKPIQTQFKANTNPNKPNTNPIQTQTNPISEAENAELDI